MESLVEKNISRKEWEKPYLQALIDMLRPTGDLLEVGFGLGYSADFIQSYSVRHHTIIDPDPVIAGNAMKWAKGKPSITIIQDTWENALPKLGIFDAIFFNQIETDSIQNSQQASLIVQKGRELISNIKKQLPQMMSIKYSDSDLEMFFKDVGAFRPAHMANFLFELINNGQISKEQYEKLLIKHSLERNESVLSIRKGLDPVLVFLEACLKNHMRKGSRFSWFASSPKSKYECPDFFERIVTNPNLDYQEKSISINVPSTCEYYQYQEALVMVVEKYD